MNSRTVFQALTFVSMAICGAVPANSCSCQEISFEDSVSKSSVIALVEVTSVTVVHHDFQLKGRTVHEDSQDVHLIVHATWKGAFSSPQRISGGGMCGFVFRPGEQYLLYGSYYQDSVHTSMCTRTQEYSRAEGEASRLGTPAWADSDGKHLFPRKSAGLSVSIKPAKNPISIFDEVAFDVTFKNRSDRPIRLPSTDLVRDDFIHVVIMHKGRWWTTIGGNGLRESHMNWSPLAPGEKRTLRVAPRQAIIREIGDYSVQAVIHSSASSPDFWNGYVFSDPTRVSLAQK
jgi:hypothetical protein